MASPTTDLTAAEGGSRISVPVAQQLIGTYKNEEGWPPDRTRAVWFSLASIADIQALIDESNGDGIRSGARCDVFIFMSFISWRDRGLGGLISVHDTSLSHLRRAMDAFGKSRARGGLHEMPGRFARVPELCEL